MPPRVRRTSRAAVSALVGLAVGVASLVLPAAPAQAAGVTTHGWMSLSAIDRVTIPELKALLEANREAVRTGAHFPDSGYAPTLHYGEEAHWQRFADAYADRIRSRDDCGDVTAPTGPCAGSIAFLMGIMGHGMGDEVWDWLFEPNSPDLDEYYLHPDFGDFGGPGGQETQMDLVAISIYGRSLAPLGPIPSRADVLATFAAVDFTQVSDADLTFGQLAMGVVQQAEATWAARHAEAVREAMPWMTHNLVTAPGGVDFAAVAIAGYWETVWGRILGAQPPTTVSITYPADGERRVPATGWVRSIEPGSHPGRGGARVRITAALTSSRPYLPLNTSPGSIPSLLPTGSMTLVERDTETPVPIASGSPRSVPYTPSAGHHLVDIQPAVDLLPCTWYRVDVTEALIDGQDESVVPHSWAFRTGTDGAGNRCADDPYTAAERYVRKLTADLLDREATEQELRDAGWAFDRGHTRRAHATGVLADLELRQLLVAEAFERYLGRAVDPSGLAYWSSKLTEISLPELHARLAGSDEVFRAAGQTNAGYVAALYPPVHRRPVDPSGLAYWTGRLDRGLSRVGLARLLLTSHESARRTVTEAYADLLGRTPDPSGLAYWTGVVQRGADPRQLWLSLVTSNEYVRLAEGA